MLFVLVYVVVFVVVVYDDCMLSGQHVVVGSSVFSSDIVEVSTNGKVLRLIVAVDAMVYVAW